MPRDVVILTVFNRPELVLLNTLTALAYNDLTDTEVLVVDDGSTEDYEAVWAVVEAIGLPVRRVRVDTVLDRPGTANFGGHNNPAYANNVALKETTGAERLFWLSSDVILPRFALERARKWIEKDAIYVPKTVNMADGQVFCGRERLFPMMWFVGARREDCLECGGMDEEFLKGMGFEDCDFMGRLFQRVGRLIVDTATMVFHQSHPLVYVSDGGEAYRASEKYMESKWGPKPPFSDNGKPFAWFTSTVGEFLLLTLDHAKTIEPEALVAGGSFT